VQRGQPLEDFDHANRADRGRHVDGQALPRELIDHRQALDLLAALARLLARFPKIELDGAPERDRRIRFRGFRKLNVWVG
jgi:hypothetical protein